MKAINGVLVLDKPEGISSNQALQRAKRLFGAQKAGHTGSLDVLASGLLPVCFGEATKFAKFLLDADKYYRVTAKLGERTTTCDREGEVIETKPVNITKEQLQEVLQQFMGESKQTPSMYSALKHQGQPLYKLARKGVEVERKQRTINISKLELLDWQDDTFSVDVHCSKGTYIRNLIDDMGQVLGCGAYVLSLRRLQAGGFTAEQMLTIDKLSTIKELGDNALTERLLPTDCLVANLPSIDVTATQADRLLHGQKISAKEHEHQSVELTRVYCDKTFIGLAEIDELRVIISKRMLSRAACGL